MDRHPQQIKRERQDIKRRARNISSMSRLRTQIKRVLEGISPSLFLSIPSLNSFGVGVPAREGGTPLEDLRFGGQLFKSLPSAKMCNFPFDFNTQVFPLLNDEVELQDIFTDTDTNKHLLVRAYNSKYENPDVGNPATALITNNIWIPLSKSLPKKRVQDILKDVQPDMFLCDNFDDHSAFEKYTNIS